MKYAIVPESIEGLYSYNQILDENVSVEFLEIFQSHEDYMTRGKSKSDEKKAEKFAIDQAVLDSSSLLETTRSAVFIDFR